MAGFISFRCKSGRLRGRNPSPLNLNQLQSYRGPQYTSEALAKLETPSTGLAGSSSPFSTWLSKVFRLVVRPVHAASVSPPDEKDIRKREGYLSWEEYYMAIANLSAKRSKDPNTQVGACIVNQDKKIVGVGYNGMPIGCSDDDLPWGKGDKQKLETKYPFVCHAEMNAIVNKMEADVRGCTMYVSLFPCCECAKLIIQSGIKEVVYYSDAKAEEEEFRAAKMLFHRANVKFRPYKSKDKSTKILVDFDNPTKDA